MRMLKICLMSLLLALSASEACRGQAVRDTASLSNGVGQFEAQHGHDTTRHNDQNQSVRSPRAPTKLNPTFVDSAVARTQGAVVVGAVLVQGAPEIAPPLFMPAIAPFIGKPLQKADLQQLLAAVSGVARDQGYALSHSTIPEQAFRAGVLTVMLDLGRIDRIDLIGDHSTAVRQVLSLLLGKPARQSALERQLLLAGDIPGIEIGDVSFIHDGDKGVLRVTVHHKDVSVNINTDNRGNSALGPMRLSLAYDLNGVLGDERITFSEQIQTTPIQPGQLFTTSTRMAYVFDNSGSEVSLSATFSRTRPGGPVAGQGLGGSVREVSASISHPVVRSRTSSLWVGATLQYQALDQWQDQSTIWRDRTALLGVYVNGNTEFARGRLRGGLSANSLLALQGLTLPGDPLSSRPGSGGGARYVNGWGSWEGALVGPVSARVAFSGQLANAPLPIAQQLSIGGPEFGRAYDFSERTGDEGALGSVEVRYRVPEAITGPETPTVLYGFADAGYVTNLANPLGTGSLVSAGFGSRFTMLQYLHMGVELAFPVNQPRIETDSHAPRFSLNLGANF